MITAADAAVIQLSYNIDPVTVILDSVAIILLIWLLYLLWRRA